VETIRASWMPFPKYRKMDFRPIYMLRSALTTVANDRQAWACKWPCRICLYIQRKAIDSICYAYSSIYWPCYQWACIARSSSEASSKVSLRDRLVKSVRRCVTCKQKIVRVYRSNQTFAKRESGHGRSK